MILHSGVHIGIIRLVVIASVVVGLQTRRPCTCKGDKPPSVSFLPSPQCKRRGCLGAGGTQLRGKSRSRQRSNSTVITAPPLHSSVAQLISVVSEAATDRTCYQHQPHRAGGGVNCSTHRTYDMESEFQRRAVLEDDHKV